MLFRFIHHNDSSHGQVITAINYFVLNGIFEIIEHTEGISGFSFYAFCLHFHVISYVSLLRATMYCISNSNSIESELSTSNTQKPNSECSKRHDMWLFIIKAFYTGYNI